jgi:5-methylcytosine-specific restriction endonuclease McrA
MSELLKKCNGCGIEKPHSAFGHVKPGRGDQFNLASQCKKCRAARNLQWHKDNPVRSKALKDDFNVRRKDHISAYNKAKREANPQLHATRYRSWAKKNRPKLTAKQNERGRTVAMATPRWLSGIQKTLIREFFELAAARRMQTGKPHHVDHIVPIDGKTFSGLNVPWNLQILEAKKNVAKKNRIPTDLAHVFWETA